jgi:hypothetical protein
MMEKVLEQNEEMQKRLAQLECRYDLRTASERSLEDDQSTIRGPVGENEVRVTLLEDSTTRVIHTSSIQREFEVVLEASRVYRMAEPNTCDTSFSSSTVRSHAWSALSGLSLADISVISVIALPLSFQEIRHMQVLLFNDFSVDPKGFAESLLPIGTASPLSNNPVQVKMPLRNSTTPGEGQLALHKSGLATVTHILGVPRSLWLSTRKPRKRAAPSRRKGFKMKLYKLVVLGDGGVGKKGLMIQVSGCLWFIEVADKSCSFA